MCGKVGDQAATRQGINRINIMRVLTQWMADSARCANKAAIRVRGLVNLELSSHPDPITPL